MGKLVMGYWDCPYCDHKEIPGDQAKCPQCGRPRGDVKFYMKGYSEGQTREENERGDIEYVDPETAKYVNRNPDWYCSFCNTLNSDNAEKCGNCGSTRADSETNYFDQLRKRQQRQQPQPQPSQPEPQKQSSFKPLLIILLIAAALFGVFKFMTANKTQGDLKVTGIEWARNINIEQNLQYSESGWQLPDGAELTGKKEEIHHYDSVLDHYQTVPVQRSKEVLDHYESYYTYEDKGNGYYEEVENQRPIYKTEYYTEYVQQPVYRQEARYQTKYYYTVWRWTPKRDVSATGTSHEAYWPEVNLAEDEREGTRSEAYAFTVADEKKNTTATYQLSESDWRNVNEGDYLYITARRTGSGAFISDENGNKIADIVKIK